MKIPYNVVHASGNILFAARGGKIHSFNLDGTHISTWKHPDVEKVAAAEKAAATKAEDIEKPVGEDTEMVEAGDLDEPPAKRQKVSEDETKGNGDEESTQTVTAEKDNAEKKGGRGGKKSKNRQKNDQNKKESFFSRVPDRPVITHMTSTSDGQHLLAISGHDKNIWVFEHEGKGPLTQLSQRTMPKRPSSVAIAPDSTIVCADKFGDVYSLPLIFDPSAPLSTPTTSTPAPEKAAFKPQANATTVHSQRNRRALDMQQRQMELASRSKRDGPTKTESNFEHTLLLGHVSMLTSLVLGESEGRRYIVTGDRDEHIRVSRYIPQAYVIEGFCLGHEQFVSKLTIPASRGEVLISGGGDEELFLWDWKAATLLSKTSILSLAQEIVPETTKVAVSRLCSGSLSTESGKHVYVLAICEAIQAVFSWQLTEDNTLNHPAIIQLPGKPLDLELISSEGESPKLIVAIEPVDLTKAKSLNIYTLTMNDEKLATENTIVVEDGELEAEELDVPEKELKSLLYNTESLRKQATEQGEEAGDEEDVVEVEKEAEVEAIQE